MTIEKLNKRLVRWSLLFALVGVQTSIGVMPENYLSNFDLRWNQLPEEWASGAFCGNGQQGMMVWGDYDGGLRFDLGDTFLYKGKSRIPVGKFVLTPAGTTAEFSMRQSLVRSEISGELTTEKGALSFHCFMDMNRDIGRILVSRSGAEQLRFSHVPTPGIESDKLWKALKRGDIDYTEPSVYSEILALDCVKKAPAETTEKVGDIHCRKVPFDQESGYILVWKVAESSAQSELIWTTYIYHSEETSDPKLAVAKLTDALKVPREEALQNHYATWSDYFEGSFISIPDKRIEANYWAQVYKMRAAARPGGLPIDLLGPWFRATPWPRIWCNLNIQVTYPVMNQANKYDVARTLFDHMDLKKDHFIKAVDKKFQSDGASVGRGWAPFSGTGFWGEYGNYLWMLYNYSQFLSFFPDESRQAEEYYPMLKRGINFVIHNLTQDDKGIYHVPADVSPEYKTDEGIPEVPDNNYNLGLLKWALVEALHLAEKLDDTSLEIDRYRSVQKNLVPLQIDPETGIMVGKGYTMDFCHRHFSHLIAFYPLGMVDVNTADGYALAEKSVERWLTRPRWGWGYQGYTYTVATAMYSRLSQPEKALESLNRYLDDFAEANTFYVETGPVIETTMNSASATLEMLVQSFNPDPAYDEIRVFTSIPAEWKDVSVAGLRTQGGHVVDAQMVDGKITGIHVVAGSDRQVKILYPSEAKLSLPAIAEQTGSGAFTEVTATMKKGESITLGRPLSGTNVRPVNGTGFHFGIN